ncbi:MAG: purine-nucleoside phosphorylase [Meiothermus sp.]
MALHIRANPGDIAPLVLLPGDPGRAEWIAETFLEDVKTYNTYRALLGFTGIYKGVPVSVQTSAMGGPSTAIVVEEIINLGVKAIIRVGTTGGIDGKVGAGTLVIAQGAVPLDGTTRQYLGGRPYAPVADWDVLEALVGCTREAKLPYTVGLISTEDAFYATSPEAAREWAKFGVVSLEMESAPLFLIAKMRGVRAGTILTVSNQIGDASFVAQEILQAGVENMTRVALEALLKLKDKI